MSNTEGRNKYNRPLSVSEQKKMIKTGAVLVSAAMIFMVGLALLVHYELVSLAPKEMKVETLKSFANRIEYALRYQTLLVFWLLVNVLITIYGRFTTRALNPLDETTEQEVEVFKRILTNSFEQIIISVLAQLTFVSFAEPLTILKFIPYINIVQFVGRVAFLAGYPLYRAFGFNCTAVPNIVLVCYNLYSLGSFIGLY